MPLQSGKWRWLVTLVGSGLTCRWLFASRDRAREFLRQTTESIHAPAGAQMLAASAVDAMLKAKGYTDGSLYSRIDKASKDHLITDEMAAWAHEVRRDVGGNLFLGRIPLRDHGVSGTVAIRLGGYKNHPAAVVAAVGTPDR